MKNGIKCLWDNKNAYLCTMVALKRCGGSFDCILVTSICLNLFRISGRKDQRTFFDYIKLSSDEIADKIMEKLRQSENVGNEGLF